MVPRWVWLFCNLSTSFSLLPPAPTSCPLPPAPTSCPLPPAPTSCPLPLPPAPYLLPPVPTSCPLPPTSCPLSLPPAPCPYLLPPNPCPLSSVPYTFYLNHSPSADSQPKSGWVAMRASQTWWSLGPLS